MSKQKETDPRKIENKEKETVQEYPQSLQEMNALTERFKILQENLPHLSSVRQTESLTKFLGSLFETYGGVVQENVLLHGQVQAYEKIMPIIEQTNESVALLYDIFVPQETENETNKETN